VTSTTEQVVWHGTESLRPFLVDATALSTHPNNPRRGDIHAIAASLDAFGQVHPIVVRDGVIVAGNHRFLAATQLLEWTHIAAIDATHLTDEELERFLIGDNRTGDLGTYDDEALSTILRRLSNEARLYGTGYDVDQVDDYLASLSKMEETERVDRSDLMRHAENLRDVTLIFEESKANQFGIFVKMLRHAYGTTGIADTVYRAVEESAKAL
jgi:ParB-like chromosome segregation protein Spo0J